MSLLAAYRPLNTPLHRTPAWIKILLLFVVALAVIFITDYRISLGILALSLILLISVRPPLKTTIRTLVFMLLVAASTAIFHYLQGDIPRAIDIAADLITLISLSLAITYSTSMAEMLDATAALFKPVNKILPSETMGLIIALMIRTIPEVLRIFDQSKDAAKARGISGNLKAVLLPTTVRTVGLAIFMGQALHARGIAEEAD